MDKLFRILNGTAPENYPFYFKSDNLSDWVYLDLETNFTKVLDTGTKQEPNAPNSFATIISGLTYNDNKNTFQFKMQLGITEIRNHSGVNTLVEMDNLIQRMLLWESNLRFKINTIPPRIINPLVKNIGNNHIVVLYTFDFYLDNTFICC